MRITLGQIAEQAGVDKSTVCRALRGQKGVGTRTRARICSLAEEMGYRPDPGLSSLSSYRWGRLRERGEVIAFVTNDEETEHVGDRAFRAAGAEADRLGYRIEEFPLIAYASSKHLWAVLLNRGVSGILMSDCKNYLRPLQLPWDRIPTVALSTVNQSYPVHRVTENAYLPVAETWLRLWQAGYRRIGYVHADLGLEADHIRKAAVHHFHRFYSEDLPIPPLFLRIKEEDHLAPDLFQRWLDEFRPDAVIGQFSHYHQLLRKMGVAIPGSLAFVALILAWRHPEICGWMGRREVCARKAIRLIDSMVRHQDSRSLEERSIITIMPEWVPGPSFPESGRPLEPDFRRIPASNWRDTTPWKSGPSHLPWLKDPQAGLGTPRSFRQGVSS